MGMKSMHPPMEPLRQVLHRLKAAGIEAAVGGSGLLFPHGLVDRVNDWDLTTDAEPHAVRAALAGLTYLDRTGGSGYVTRARLVVQMGGEEIDLICQGGVETEVGVTRFPTFIAGEYQGIPLGSMEVWAAFYWLIGRRPKAELALGWLERNGAHPARLQRVLQEPLPSELRGRLEALRP